MKKLNVVWNRAHDRAQGKARNRADNLAIIMKRMWLIGLFLVIIGMSVFAEDIQYERKSHWETDWGMLTLLQNGEKVTGYYEYNGNEGKLDGSLDEDGTLAGYWLESQFGTGAGPDGDYSGPFMFHFNDDATAFNGFWGEVTHGVTRISQLNQKSHTWNGVLAEGELKLP